MCGFGGRLALCSSLSAMHNRTMSASFPQDVRWGDPQVALSLPQAYPRQEGLSCGETNARSVIESFGLSFERPTRPGWKVRLFGYSLLRDLRSLMESHGLSAPIRSAASVNAPARLDVLRSHLRKGYPIVIAIGNGHLRRGRYVPAARVLLGHYLTLYGFEDASETFFVYDSYLDGEPEGPLPAGNETRTYAETLRDWRGPFYYPLIGRRHAYMPVSPRTEETLN